MRNSKRVELIRPMQNKDIESVVRIHLEAFQGYFLAFLGKKFLKEFYSAVISDQSGIAYVAIENNTVLGFVVGTIDLSGFYKRLIHRHLVKFFIASLIPALRKPAIIPRLFRALSRPQISKLERDCVKLMSLAISPTAQAKGIGKEILKAFLTESKRLGFTEVDLETDRIGNESTNTFYLSSGFSLYRSFTTHEGREMNEYRINLLENNL